jgi:hypothetical protein
MIEGGIERGFGKDDFSLRMFLSGLKTRCTSVRLKKSFYDRPKLFYDLAESFYKEGHAVEDDSA